MADGSRGRIARFVAAAGEVFGGYGALRGFLVQGPTNQMQFRNKAANGDVVVRIPNLAAGNSVYVMCDIVFADGLYLTVGGGVPNITLFYD